MALRTPVSSVIFASSVTLLPLTEAFTSVMAGGLVSSASAAKAKVLQRTRAARAVRMGGDYLEAGRVQGTIGPRRRKPGGATSGGCRRAVGGLRRELDADDLGDAGLLH